MDFKTWKAECNKIVVRNIGMTIDDLPDALWRDYYEDSLQPQAAIDCAIEDAWYDDTIIGDLFK